MGILCQPDTRNMYAYTARQQYCVGMYDDFEGAVVQGKPPKKQVPIPPAHAQKSCRCLIVPVN